MRFLLRSASALALLLLASAGAAAFERGEVWIGDYVYRTGQPPVHFTLFITRSGPGRFDGVIVEPNTFGDRAYPQLVADVSGTQDGTAFSFAKRYDGTGGQSHSVEYSGELTGDGLRRAQGTWHLPDSSGSFEMHRR
jgi:hypothetical protein